ncbi:MAG: electron transfer flavoprotein subunit alpha/FixB family protein [Thermaerobacter sp.]|nr:electron transfer flavoprotein subunit alpha/FixB family protein [Thermaerobacter sp.]
MAKILATATLQGGAATAAGLDLLGLAAELAGASGGSVTVLALGAGARAVAQSLLAQGADEVLCSEEPALAQSPSEAGLAALLEAARQVQPELLLLATDSLGRDWAPRVAARLAAGIVTEATGVAFEAGRFVGTRPVFGGKAVARMAARTKVAVMTVRPGAGSAKPPDAAGQGSGGVRDLGLEITLQPDWPEVVRREVEAVSGPRLEEAKIIVSGGRGVGGPEGFRVLQELAEELGAAVGASRAAVDEGWVPAAWQIGQTGKAVAPDLYIAVGISGASQHMVGCSRAKTLVAINTDPDALIFETAQLGLIADYREALPALAQALRESS